MHDLAYWIRAAHAAGASVVVDNTTATALAQKPLVLGADFSLGSDTKAVAGHADLLLGHVAARDPQDAELLRAQRTRTGAVPGPMETWLAHRGLATLDVRLERSSATALAVALALAEHPAVSACRYPGLLSDPGHALAASQLRYFGPVLSFTLAGQDAAERWLGALLLVIPATSFGGVHSTAERRARWGGDDIDPGFIRLSVGIEATADVVHDVLHALESVEAPTGVRR
ncbi:PLP-dependent transferase [Nocardioides rubriscoriae]|uniref:PLP-dependent transferase n=1 Tax=Nocardioides rubriscoriae TaxID=642762 RepID=UPI001B85F834|nr:PLP-dependent transferase [Nocardioides rubriscoriae]